jgi:hypothetical protein
MIEPLSQIDEAQQAVEHLVRLIETHKVDEARALAPDYAARWSASRQLQHLARVLEPPKVNPGTGGPSGRSLKNDVAWLREHAREHPGCYIATRGDEVIAIDASIDRVKELVRAAREGDPRAILLHYEPPSEA